MFPVDSFTVQQKTTVDDPKKEDLKHGCTFIQFYLYWMARLDLRPCDLVKYAGMDSGNVHRIVKADVSLVHGGSALKLISFVKAFNIPFTELAKVRVPKVVRKFDQEEKPKPQLVPVRKADGGIELATGRAGWIK